VATIGWLLYLALIVGVINGTVNGLQKAIYNSDDIGTGFTT